MATTDEPQSTQMGWILDGAPPLPFRNQHLRLLTIGQVIVPCAKWKGRHGEFYIAWYPLPEQPSSQPKYQQPEQFSSLPIPSLYFNCNGERYND